MRNIKKVAVAARGEIACQIISVCHEMNLKTVLLFAEGDEQNEAFRQAGERICIGPKDPLKSYLNTEANIEGALGAGAQALHPGYGFLAENAAFARACAVGGLVFIGPSAEALSHLGNKLSAKKTAQKAGVPTLPAFGLHNWKEGDILQKARQMSYPLLLKSSAGGGGRGLHIVRKEEELQRLLQSAPWSVDNVARSEIFLEKRLSAARHIEVQIFVSAEGELFLLSDRDCSIQRRQQKIIEEAPSGLPQKIKSRLFSACRALLSQMNYRGAGTVEFLVQGEDFYFMEMNPRLQVEHTLTEMIYGLDLVRAQILTAQGRPPFHKGKKELSPRGHSIECRICAEDPDQNFRPSGGRLLACRWPQGKNIRVDTGFHTGDFIPPFYDSLIAKLVVWDDSRTRSIGKMKKALEETIVFGLKTNTAFLCFLLSHIRFLERRMTCSATEEIHTEEWEAEGLPLPEGLLKKLFRQLQQERSALSPRHKANPWSDFLKRRI